MFKIHPLISFHKLRFYLQNVSKKLIPKDRHTMSLDIPRYLERICFKQRPEVSLKCLEELQACHQLTVPFENLDVFTGRKKILNVDLIYNQIVLKKRGGWCHELNGLFSSLLSNLGFDVKIISCLHFDRHKKSFNTVPYDHMALIVTLGSVKYLVDVGYGCENQQFKPLPISTNDRQAQEGGLYRFIFQEDEWFLQHRSKELKYNFDTIHNPNIDEEKWYTMYKFRETSRQLEEFQSCCSLYETDPSTALSCLPMCICKTNRGKEVKKLVGKKLTTITFGDNSDDEETTTSNMTDEDLNLILKSTFGIFLRDPIPFNAILQRLPR